ncbi:hypothetical protein Tco_1554560 [Tanacetum coccineum]
MMPLCNHYLWMKMTWIKGLLKRSLRRRDVMMMKVKTILRILRKSGKSKEQRILSHQRNHLHQRNLPMTWFNDLVNAEKYSLTFDELMATPIDFTKFAMNRLKLDKITKADLVGPVYKLLNGTCKSSIELEYNIDQCYNALTDQLDWTNPEDMIPRIWSPFKVAYDKDSALEFHIRDPNVSYSTDPKSTSFLNIMSIHNEDSECEGDFSKLHLNDIEDMLLIYVQNKLFNLDGDDIVDLAVALRMFT